MPLPGEAGDWGLAMRIGLVAPPWVAVPPPSYGGTEVVVDGLARGLAAVGHDVLLFTVGDSTCPVTRAWRYPSAYTPMGHYLGEAAHVLDAYAAMADRDVVHDHTVLGPLLGRPAGQLVVATCHQALTPDFARVYREVSLSVPLVAISADQRASAPEVSFVAVDPSRPRPGSVHRRRR